MFLRPPSSSRPGRLSEEQTLVFLRRILGKLGMADVDTGDLLLLLILFLLFTEGGSKDEELMIALGLLLIL